MQRYDLVLTVLSTGKPLAAIEAAPDGRLVFYEDAAEQVKKAKQEALEAALDIVADYNVEPMCAKRIRQLMEEEG